MSDNEGTTKKSGYRLEYASSARAKCKGAKPCSGTPIPKGALRVGSIVDIRGNTNFAWRHWGCTTPKIITNMKAKFSHPDDLDGFEDLKEEDQARVRRAWEDGHVTEEDVPPSARKPEGEGEEEKPKKKRVPAKKKEEADGDEEKPKKKRATKPKKTDEEAEDEDEVEAGEAEERPKSAPVKKPRAKKHDGDEEPEKRKAAPRRQVAAKKAPTKKKAKDESEASSGEDFAGELAEVEDEEDADADESAGKKRKRSATKQAATAKKPRATSSRAKKFKVVVEEEDEE